MSLPLLDQAHDIVDEDLSPPPSSPSSPPLQPLGRVKTFSELSQSVDTWNLSHDAELMQSLSLFSSSFFQKTKCIQDALDALLQDTCSTQVKVNNVWNTFSTLSDTQFIESRVYEEETITCVNEVKKEDEDIVKEDIINEKDKQAKDDASEKVVADTIMEKYKKAYHMGLQAMKLFTLETEDEEVEGVDIYNERPLPYVIGTREFLEDDTLGLGAAPESDSSEESSQGDSQDEEASEEEEESEDGSESDGSEGSDDSEVVVEKRTSRSVKPAASHVWSEEESSSDGDSEDSEEEDAPMRPPVPSFTAPQDDDDETMNGQLFGGASKAAEAIPKATSNRTMSPKASVAQSVVWSDEEEEEDDLFAYRPQKQANLSKQASYAGLFGQEEDETSTGGGGLFNAEDLDGELFTAPSVTSPRTRTLEHQESVKRTGNALFEESQEDDNWSEESEDDTPAGELFKQDSGLFTQESRTSMLPVPTRPTRSSFLDEESEEEGLFAPPTSVKKTSLSPSDKHADELKKALASSVMSRSSQGLPDEGVQSETAHEHDLLPTASSSRNSNLFGDDSDDGASSTSGLFGSSNPKTSPELASASTTRVHSSLFDGESSEEEAASDLFAAKVTSSAKIFSSSGPKKALFDDDSEESEDEQSTTNGLFGSTTPVQTPAVPASFTNNMFEQNSDDDDDIRSTSSGLFGNSTTQQSSEKEIVKTSFKSLPIQNTLVENELFASARDKPASALFDGDSSEEDASTGGLFGSTNPPIAEKEVAKAPAVVKTTPVPMMVQDDGSSSNNEWEDSGDESTSPTSQSLFGTVPTPSVTPSASARPVVETASSNKSLFGTSTVAPTSSSDLFGPPSPVATSSQKPSPAFSIPPPRARVPSDDSASSNEWQDSDDDVSLFGTGK